MSLDEATACCDQLRSEFLKDQAKAKLTLEKLKVRTALGFGSEISANLLEPTHKTRAINIRLF
jgi:hypothetical protein